MAANPNASTQVHHSSFGTLPLRQIQPDEATRGRLFDDQALLFDQQRWMIAAIDARTTYANQT